MARPSSNDQKVLGTHLFIQLLKITETLAHAFDTKCRFGVHKIDGERPRVWSPGLRLGDDGSNTHLLLIMLHHDKSVSMH